MPRRRIPTDAERALWAATMRDVRPLSPRRAPMLASPAVPAEPQRPEPVPSLRRPAMVRPAQGAVDRATVDRLRRGQIAIEGRIDLHGLDQRQAFSSLMGFVETASRAGRRALLVITGKGALGEGGGVLRRNVPAWLATSPLAGRILTIQPAHLRHGGEGAFYILLRRKRA